VNKIAVISSESPDVTKLSSALQKCHGCERVHPVASDGSADQPPSFEDLHLQICQWLQEGVLVYVIWEGSLGKLDSNCTVSRIVRLFASQNKRDMNSRRTGVVHRLILLQLGGHSGAMATRLLPNFQSLWLSHELPPADHDFDVQSYAQQVHSTVNQRLLELNSSQANHRPITDHRNAEHADRQAISVNQNNIREVNSQPGFEIMMNELKGFIKGETADIKGHINQQTGGIKDILDENKLAEQTFESELDPSVTEDAERHTSDINLDHQVGTSEAKVSKKLTK